jgi:hypothetical protein
MARAFVRYSHDYVGEEEQARLGVHAHQCQPAWDGERGGERDDCLMHLATFHGFAASIVTSSRVPL